MAYPPGFAAVDDDVPKGFTLLQGGKKEPTIGANRHQEAKIGADPRPGGMDFTVLGVPIHVPGADKPRADENMADVGGVGIPPEAVLMGPLQAGRAMLKPGLSMAGRAAAGIGSMIPHVTPVIKYEVAKHALMHVGLPESVATLAAAGFSGYKRGARTAAAETVAKETAAVPAAAEAVAPQAIDPGFASAEAVTARLRTPTGAMTAARGAFKQSGIDALPGEASNTMELIRRGKSPDEALQIVLKNRLAATTLTPAEEFAKRYGTPSEAERRAVQDKNWASGEVKTPSAETARERRGY